MTARYLLGKATKPFTIKVPHDLVPDNDIFEMFCNENEKDRQHLKQK
jgi:hypothetical protein